MYNNVSQIDCDALAVLLISLALVLASLAITLFQSVYEPDLSSLRRWEYLQGTESINNNFVDIPRYHTLYTHHNNGALQRAHQKQELNYTNNVLFDTVAERMSELPCHS
ncbi:hypothetical protein WA026_020883 [Henosepilachna vigintioctopunctata]|uniref:Uncharacterized protein n=1 Tax=Henosepilachna vigintioctopunctata TaxID=420089 RepID=A0AAW1US62_9CUCU